MRHEINKDRPMKYLSRLALLALCTMMAFSSCRKEEDTIALIKVIDVDGFAISDAFVRLYPEPTNSSGDNVGELIDDVEQITDAAGEALFDFTEFYEEGQAGFAVLSVEVYKDSLAVEGIIKIDPEVVNEETLILQ